MTDALKLTDVSKQFAQFALRNLTFALPEGFIMGLIGPNGSGKTTTVQLILNMLKRDGGDISLFGLDNIREESAVKQQIGIVFDSTFFVDDWNVRDVEPAIAGFYRGWDGARYRHLLSRFDLSLNKKIKELSRGMQMKLMLSCALAHDARLLILDEPTSGLDPLARSELLDLLQEYIQDGKHSVLFSTHITTDLERVADFITLINRGELLFTGEKDAFLQSYAIVRGKPGALSEAARKALIGYRETGSAFEGLVDRKDAARFPSCVIDRPTIDDIMIFIGREG